ncbi:MAG: lysylphosphatidylglycerol synthase transmembrane domain-containing protein [Verrucomicrobiota bacterium]
MRRFALRAVVSVALSGCLLIALFRLASPRAVGDLLVHARPGNLAAGFGLYALGCLARARRLRLIGLRVPLRALMAIGCVHQALNRLLPLRTGELSYPWLARRIGGQGFGQAMIGLAYLRVLDLAAVAVLFAVTLDLGRRSFLGDPRLGLVGSALLLAGAVAILVWLLPLLRLCVDVGERLLGPRRLLQRARATVDGFPRLDGGAHLRLAALSVAGWLFIYGTFAVLMAGFGKWLGLTRTILGATASVIASVQPIQGVGSFGTLEAGWALGMSLVGLDRGAAVATGVGVQLFTFAYAAILGVWGWLVLARRAPRDGLGVPG